MKNNKNTNDNTSVKEKQNETQAKLNDNNEKSCCAPKPKEKPKNVWQAIGYGLIPHIGCIAFIIGSILGVTVLTSFFKPLLMNKNFFYILILISLVFATISSVLYLRKNGFLSGAGIKKKWKYLMTMYGTTVVVNLLLFMVIFPLLANVSIASAQQTSNVLAGNEVVVNTNALSSIKLKVSIPCSGHAPLISSELKTIAGVTNVRFSLPNIFDVTYDNTIASKQQILGLSVFQEYKATVLEESFAPAQPSAPQNTDQPPVQGGCGCGGSGNGGASSGGCGGGTGGCGGTCGAY